MRELERVSSALQHASKLSNLLQTPRMRDGASGGTLSGEADVSAQGEEKERKRQSCVIVDDSDVIDFLSQQYLPSTPSRSGAVPAC